MSLAERLSAVRGQVADSCRRAGRPVESVTLIAVSKTHPAASVLEAVACGQAHFGENRIEEAAPKIEAVAAGTSASLVWHMIGHVQSRKAREVVAAVDWIHSLDTVKLAERYSRFAVELNRTVNVLLEVNVSGEASKSGFEGSTWQQDHRLLWDEVRQIVALPGIRVRGLMTMAPIVEHMEQARPVFRRLRELRDGLATDFPSADWSTLSMGMTDDYPVAIEEGATMVRVGRAIFGPREP